MSGNDPYASGPYNNGPQSEGGAHFPSGNPQPNSGYQGYPPYQGYGQDAGYGQNPYPQGPEAYGGYAPYAQYGPPQSQYGAPWTPPPYASWGTRVGARLLDSIIGLIPFAVLVSLGGVMAFHNSHDVTQPDGTSRLTGVNDAGVALMILGFLVSFLFNFWNLGIRQGKTGQSIGKKVVHIRVVDENTGQPAGAGAGLGRYLVEFVIGLISSCVGILSLLDLLWPLWDAKNQTLHDKVVHTVVLHAPKTGS